MHWNRQDSYFIPGLFWGVNLHHNCNVYVGNYPLPSVHLHLCFHFNMGLKTKPLYLSLSCEIYTNIKHPWKTGYLYVPFLTIFNVWNLAPNVKFIFIIYK
jgi:hypothetical protein